MLEQKHPLTEQRKVSRKRAKVLRPTFELNLVQTEMAKALDPEAYGATSLNTLAKKLFLEYMEENG